MTVQSGAERARQLEERKAGQDGRHKHCKNYFKQKWTNKTCEDLTVFISEDLCFLAIKTIQLKRSKFELEYCLKTLCLN